MRIRSLILFDLKDTIIHSNSKVLEFVNLYGIKNKTDINNLFTFFALSNILEIYKEHKNGLVLFYCSLNDYNNLQKKRRYKLF
jgi:hypothetical protein